VNSPTQLHINNLSPYARQYDVGFKTLTFEESLESEFRTFHNEISLDRVRLTLIWTTIFFFAFGILDILTLPQQLSNSALIIRFGFICPILFITWITSYSQNYQDRMIPFLFVSMFTVGIGTVVILHLAHEQGIALPDHGLMLIILIIYLMSGLRLKAAATIALSVSACYLVSEFITSISHESMTYTIFFLAGTNILGIISSYIMEYAGRSNYLYRKILVDASERDGLTGIYNRRMFSVHYERAWRQASRDNEAVGLMFADIDLFQNYSELYGHSSGDECLKRVARVLNSEAKRPLDLTARYAGDRFAVIWYGCSDEVEALSLKLHRQIERLEIEHKGSDVSNFISFSAGVSYIKPSTQQSSEELIRLADEALYQAKTQGKNQIICNYAE